MEAVSIRVHPDEQERELYGTSKALEALQNTVAHFKRFSVLNICNAEQKLDTRKSWCLKKNVPIKAVAHMAAVCAT